MDWDDLFNEPDAPAEKPAPAPVAKPAPAKKPVRSMEAVIDPLLSDEKPADLPR
jgi:hypothetical protein